MKTKILKKLLLLIIGILGISYYSFFTSENIISSKIIKPVKNIPVLENIITVFPVRLKIPKIGVDTEVINIGITPTGILDSPKDITYAGLYNLWPIPWEEGSAVIDGHFGWINKKPAVFNNLFKLQKWDEIYFHDKKGNIITFIVNKIKIYNQNEATADIFNSNDWKSHLNIITCEGIRDKTKKSYPNRLVVFTDKLIK